MNLKIIKKIRKETGISVVKIKNALEEAGGSEQKARAILQKTAGKAALKRSEKSAKQGVVEAYSHGGKIGVLAEVNCETDFVARNPDFVNFAHDIALQVAAMKPKNIKDLLAQNFIKDEKLTIKDLLNNIASKTGEKIEISRIKIFELGGRD